MSKRNVQPSYPIPAGLQTAVRWSDILPPVTPKR
jgi:hypothetical protein